MLGFTCGESNDEPVGWPDRINVRVRHSSLSDIPKATPQWRRVRANRRERSSNKILGPNVYPLSTNATCASLKQSETGSKLVQSLPRRI